MARRHAAPAVCSEAAHGPKPFSVYETEAEGTASRKESADLMTILAGLQITHVCRGGGLTGSADLGSNDVGP